MGQVIFLDIDGTLVNFQQRISEETRLALQQAGKNGHKLVLCTDRAYTGIYPWLMKMPFDGVVASSGAYVRCGDEVVVHHMLDNGKVRELTELLWQHGAATLTQGLHARYVNPGHERRYWTFLPGEKWMGIRY